MQANRTRKNLSCMFSWLLSTHENTGLHSNPVLGLRNSEIVVGTKRQVTPEGELLHQIFEAAGRLPYPMGPIYQLLILTGCRLREIAHARKEWLNLEGDELTLTVPSDNTKIGEAHIVPLVGKALEIFRPLPEFSGPFLFSTTGGETPVNNFDHDVLWTEAGIENPDLRAHDFRRSVRCGLAAVGIADNVAESVLGHRPVGIVGVYNTYTFVKERRVALTLWAERFGNMDSAKQQRVITFPHASKCGKRCK